MARVCSTCAKPVSYNDTNCSEMCASIAQDQHESYLETISSVVREDNRGTVNQASFNRLDADDQRLRR